MMNLVSMVGWHFAGISYRVHKCRLLWCFLLVYSLLAAASWATEAKLDSTFAFREIFLPPGLPSVALRTDETALLWNPAGIGISNTYYLGYAWKGIYEGDHIEVISQFFLAKSKGFGLGIMHDTHSSSRANTYIFTLAPSVSKSLSIGFTGKWRSGFNFDLGLMGKVGDHVSVGLVGRNIRRKSDARRFYEGGMAINLIPHRLSTFIEIVNEDSRWHKATAYGLGLLAAFKGGVSASVTYFAHSDNVSSVRATLRFVLSRNIIEGEYSTFNDDSSVLGGRIVSHSP